MPSMASPRARPTLPMMRARPAPLTSSGSRPKSYVPPAMAAIRNTCTWTPRRARKFGSKCRCDEIACRVDGVLIFIQRHCRANPSSRRKMDPPVTDERCISFTETCSKLNKNVILPEENVVKVVAKVVLLAATGAAMVGVGGQSSVGQYSPANTGWWGTEIPAKDIDPDIRAAADALGLIRDTRLVIGQVNLLEYVGSGTMVDVESTTPGRQLEVGKFSYAVALQIPASRLDFETASGRTVR